MGKLLHNPKDQTFGHNGDLGDIIYSLPTIRAAGGGTLCLWDQPGKTHHGMSQQKADLLRPLLMEQSYIRDVKFTTEKVEHNINGFRDHGHPGRNLAEMHLSTMGFSFHEASRKWLSVKPQYESDVVIWWTDRHHSFRFPWERFKNLDPMFLGLPEEHQKFEEQFFKVKYRPTADFLEVAQIIAGSQYGIGNESVIAAILHGLHHPGLIEINDYSFLAVFSYMGLQHAWSPYFE